MKALLSQCTRLAVPLALLVTTVGVPAIAAKTERGLLSTENATVFLEKSYISLLTLNNKNLFLEGYAANHYWFVNSLGDAAWRREGGVKWKNFPISMIFVARIFKVFSSPVRTPSFILRPLYMQLFYLNRSGTGTNDRFRLFALGVGAHTTQMASLAARS